MFRITSSTQTGGHLLIAWQAGKRCAFIVMLLAILCGVAQAAGTNPNIVFILADDLGYGDVSCYNAQSKVPTPRIDRLAREGMRFTDAHSPSTVCTPTRYSLITGQMAFRVPRGGLVFTGVGGPSLIAPGDSRCRQCSAPKAIPQRASASGTSD